MTTDLMKRFWKPGYETDEFAAVLHRMYNRSVNSAEETIFGDQASPSLILKFRGNGSIRQILAGPSFVDGDTARIEQALAAALDQSVPAVRRFLVTTHRPLVGALGFEDWFAFLPAPDHAPRPTGDVFGGHPAILEIRVAGSTDASVTHRRAKRALLDLEALFAMLTKENVAPHPASQRFQWVIDPADATRSIYTHTNYQLDGFVTEADALSDIGPYPDVAEVAVDRYYAPGFHGSAVLALPVTFFALLSRYRRIDRAARDKFLRAGYWAKLQPELRHVSKAATYAAIIRAIEALMPGAPPGDPCDACGTRAGRGTRQAFARFVDEMAGGAMSEKERLQLYDRRSRLVHGDQLFTWDEELFMSGPRELGEMSELDTVAQLAHILFHNWLCDQPLADTEASA